MLILSSPLFAYLELTPACNNRCPGCGNVFERAQTASLSAKQWQQVLRKLHPSVLRLRLTGGEPTLHPEFEAIIRVVSDLDLPFALFSNARWSRPAHLLETLSGASNFLGMLVSLHGPDAASHDAFTGIAGSFTETIGNIRRAVEAGLPISTSTIITNHNYDRLAEVIKLSQELGAAHAVFNRYLTTAEDRLAPTEEQLRVGVRTVEDARQHGAAVRFSVCIPQCFQRSTSAGCLAGIAYLTVDPWGNVRPCNHAPSTVGNLLEQSVEEVWHSTGMQRWRERIPQACMQCEVLPRCHGGCRAIMLLQSLEHDPLMREPIFVPETSMDLRLAARACPHFDGLLRPEPFGYAAVHGNRVVPVSGAAHSVLSACDGHTTLHQIQARFGQRGLDFVAALYRSGLIEMR